VLLIWGGEHTWAKLCFEYSPQREPMVVSVVTNGTSDDANAFTVASDTVRLRIARIGQAFAFHAAVAGGQWQLIRHFALANAGPIAAGFVAQSPTGAGCTAHFSEVVYTPERLADLRSGV
jgi:regulation of enolase protein 1 (concanavalin A-like superfamily)